MTTGRISNYQKGKGYESIPRELLQNKELSLESIALLSYMQSLPETWVLYKTQLYKQFPKNKRSSIDRMWKELVEQKYLLNFRKREGKKYIYNYLFSIVPFTDEQIQDIIEEQNSNDFWSVDFQQSKMNSSKSTPNKLTTKKSNTKKLTKPKDLKKDDDENLINKQTPQKELVDIIQESQDLKELTQQLIESDVDLEETEKIISHFYETDNHVDLKIAKQQLEWMQVKNKEDVGISSFKAYFIYGYNNRLTNNRLVVANNREAEQEELPAIPMFNWLKNG